MLRTSMTLAAFGLALSIAPGCANNPFPQSDQPQSQPSYLNDDCSAQSQYEKKACIPTPPPPPPKILDYD